MKLKATIAAGVVLIIFAILAGIFLKDLKNKNSYINKPETEETGNNALPTKAQ